MRVRKRCHYCGRAGGRLRVIELHAGRVYVCTDTESCHRRHREGWGRTATGMPIAAAPTRSSTRTRRSTRLALLVLVAAIVGLVVLPHLTIAGHHWRILFF